MPTYTNLKLLVISLIETYEKIPFPQETVPCDKQPAINFFNWTKNKVNRSANIVRKLRTFCCTVITVLRERCHDRPGTCLERPQFSHKRSTEPNKLTGHQRPPVLRLRDHVFLAEEGVVFQCRSHCTFLTDKIHVTAGMWHNYIIIMAYCRTAVKLKSKILQSKLSLCNKINGSI